MPQTVPVDVASLTSEPAAYRSVPYGREPVRSAMPPIGSYPNIFRPIRQHPKPSRPVRQDPRTQAIPSVPWLASQAVPCSSIPTSSDTRHCVDSCSSVLHRSRSPHAASQHSRAPPHARGRWRSPSGPARSSGSPRPRPRPAARHFSTRGRSEVRPESARRRGGGHCCWAVRCGRARVGQVGRGGRAGEGRAQRPGRAS